MEQQFTAISELGEFKLIEALTSGKPQKNASSIKMVGDDAAQISYKDEETLVSTDIFIHGVHFDLAYFPLNHLGFKCIVAGISDIYAMNAKPEQVLVSIAMSNQFSVEMAELLYQGMHAACDEYNVDLVGGDTSTIHRGLIINITAIGRAPKDQIVYRNGAQENDLICVTGDTGAAYLGLQLLEREKQVWKQNPEVQPELNEDNEYLLQRFLKPDCRDDVIKILKEKGIKPSSMIDISDGISSEIKHLAQQSNLGATIYENKLPIHPNTVAVAEEFKMNPTTCALNGGEDYELLFTVHPSHFEELAKVSEISIIGHTTHINRGLNLITNNGNSFELLAQGWDSFGE